MNYIFRIFYICIQRIKKHSLFPFTLLQQKSHKIKKAGIP